MPTWENRRTDALRFIRINVQHRRAGSGRAYLCEDFVPSNEDAATGYSNSCGLGYRPQSALRKTSNSWASLLNAETVQRRI